MSPSVLATVQMKIKRTEGFVNVDRKLSVNPQLEEVNFVGADSSIAHFKSTKLIVKKIEIKETTCTKNEW
jgi:hypothetical protein